MGNVKGAIVIPARYASSRFPGKLLEKVGGKTVLDWTYQNCRKAVEMSEGRLEGPAIVADDELFDAVLDANYDESWVFATFRSPAARNGTERVAWYAQDRNGVYSFDFYINVQADEALLAPEAILKLLETPGERTTLARMMGDSEIDDENVVKVGVQKGYAAEFRRASSDFNIWKAHVGAYLWPRGDLLAYAQTKPGGEEEAKSLEQLRRVGGQRCYWRVHTVPYEQAPFAINTPEDLERMKEWVKPLDMHSTVATKEQQARLRWHMKNGSTITAVDDGKQMESMLK